MKVLFPAIGAFLALALAFSGCGSTGAGAEASSTPTNLQGYLKAVVAANKADEFERGVQLCTDGLQKYPDCWDFLEQRAYFYSRLGQFDKQIDDCTRALKKPPPGAKWRILDMRGGAYLAKKEYKPAENDFAAACKALPSNDSTDRVATLWFRRGAALLRLGRPKEAVSAFNQTLKLRPKDGRALGGRCLAYSRLNDQVNFKKDYATIKKEFPDVLRYVDAALKAKLNAKLQPKS